MTAISADRLGAILARRDELQNQLASGELAPDRFVALSKEYAEVEPVAEVASKLQRLRTDLVDLQAMLDVNLFGAIHLTHPALAALKQSRGLVVAISSVAGYTPLIARTAYAASKHALHGMFESLRTDPDKTTFNAFVGDRGLGCTGGDIWAGDFIEAVGGDKYIDVADNTGGFAYGATDSVGLRAAEDMVHIRDFHATLLNQLGVDHEQLTYKYQGRYFRLTDVHGHVVKNIIKS